MQNKMQILQTFTTFDEFVGSDQFFQVYENFEKNRLAFLSVAVRTRFIGAYVTEPDPEFDKTFRLFWQYYSSDGIKFIDEIEIRYGLPIPGLVEKVFVTELEIVRSGELFTKGSHQSRMELRDSGDIYI